MAHRPVHSAYLGATPRPHVTVVALGGLVTGDRRLRFCARVGAAS